MVVDDVTRNFPKLSSQPDAGRWYSVSPEGARSSDGSEWHGLVRMGTENKVVVFFFGGGVSLDEGMSRSNARTMSFAPTVAWQDYFVDSGIFSKSPENPFRNWTFLVLEYATGDFHAGTNEYRYVDDEGNGQVVYHAGFVNYSLFMDEVLPVVGEPDTLLVTGSSAGGFATSLLADDVIARFPSAASVTACVDSALLYYDGWQETARSLWHAPDFISDRLVGNNLVLDSLVALRRNRGDDVNILFTSSTRDHELQRFQAYIDTGALAQDATPENSELYLANLGRMCSDMEELLPGCGIYVWEDGYNEQDGSTQHMIVLCPNCLDRLSGEKSVAEWLYDAAQGDVRSFGLELLGE